MKLTKKQRAELRDKFGGRCAYCGVDLPERWHADHYEAVKRGVSSYVTGRDALHSREPLHGKHDAFLSAVQHQQREHDA